MTLKFALGRKQPDHLSDVLVVCDCDARAEKKKHRRKKDSILLQFFLSSFHLCVHSAQHQCNSICGVTVHSSDNELSPDLFSPVES